MRTQSVLWICAVAMAECATQPLGVDCAQIQSSCPAGFGWDANCQCVPQGSDHDGGCVPAICPYPSYWSDQACRCVTTSSPDGNWTSPDMACRAYPCPPGYDFDYSQCQCVFSDRPDMACPPAPCPRGSYWDYSLCQCVGVIMVDAGCLPTPCLPGEHFSYRLCQCVPNRVVDAGGDGPRMIDASSSWSCAQVASCVSSNCADLNYLCVNGCIRNGTPAAAAAFAAITNCAQNSCLGSCPGASCQGCVVMNCGSQVNYCLSN